MKTEYKYKGKEKEYAKEWYQNNKERTSAQKKIYRKNHKDEFNKKSKEYYEKNKNEITTQRHKHYYTAEGKYIAYITSAKHRKIFFDLTLEEFKQFWHQPCHYCGEVVETIGLDRVDNSKGYQIDNVVSCCEDCNRMKLQMTKEQFLKKCAQITNRFSVETYKIMEAK